MEDQLFQFYKPEEDASRADWVIERCNGPKDTLQTIMPSGFASYVRICHPGWFVEALDPDDEKSWAAIRAGHFHKIKQTPTRWQDTAIANRRSPHRLMQWHSICSDGEVELGAEGVNPPLEGELTKSMVESIFDILINHRGSDQECVCGFWEGFRQFDDYPQVPRFECSPGHQHYLLFNSSLSGIRDHWLAVHEHRAGRETSGSTPNAIWPTTCDWYLAISYEMKSSYFGGGVEIATDIGNTDNLESYNALPTDNIWKDELNF